MLYNSIKWLFDWSKNEANEELNQWLKVRRSAANPEVIKKANYLIELYKTILLEDEFIMNELDEIIDNLIYLIIYKVWNEKRQKWSYYYKTKIYVSGEENLGPQEKAITVVFAPTIDKTNLGTWVYVLDPNKNKMPKKYTISEDENGNKKFPYFYITEIEKFIPEGVYTV